MFKGVNRLFYDIMLLIAATFALILILVLPHLNEGEEKQFDVETPGAIIVRIVWDKTHNTDIDLWLKTPDNGAIKLIPIFYAEKHNRFASLLRDDLGHTGDAFEVNDEWAVVRGLVDGEFVINVHFFADKRAGEIQGTIGSEDVYVQVIYFKGESKTVAEGTITLQYVKQELTFVSFRIKDELVVENSIDRVTQKPMMDDAAEELRRRNGASGPGGGRG